jgi:hypothetical protein
LDEVNSIKRKKKKIIAGRDRGAHFSEGAPMPVEKNLRSETMQLSVVYCCDTCLARARFKNSIDFL